MGTSNSGLSEEWAQTSSSTYERAIDSLERFFIFIASVGQGRPDKQNWHFTAGLKIETRRSDFAGDVKAAWIASRFQYPVLSAVIEDDRWIYRVAEEKEQHNWLRETFHVHDTERTARQLFPFETNPSTRCVLHVLPQTQELVIQGPHTHVDGIGAATFFNHILQFLADPVPACPPAYGTEAANLTPPCAVVTNVPQCTAEQKKVWDTNLQSFLSQFPTVRVHNENKGARATTTKVQWITFSPTETSRIAARSKELGLSVTSAAQAALSLAARIHGRVPNTTHSTFAIYNARGYIDESKYPLSRLVGSNVFSMPAVFPLFPGSFVKTASAARDVFLGYKENDVLRATSHFWATEIPAALSAPLPPGMPVAADLQLSSLGVMDKYLGQAYESSSTNGQAGGRAKIEVHDFWVSLDMFSPNVAVEMWTFRDRLVIELIYNEAYHRDESITALLGLIRDQFAQGLGLDLGFDVRGAGEEEFLEGFAKREAEVKIPVDNNTLV